MNESQKPGVYRIHCECGLVYIAEIGRNLSILKSPGQPQCNACVCLRFCYVVGQRQPFLWPRKWWQQLRKVTKKRKQKRALHCG